MLWMQCYCLESFFDLEFLVVSFVVFYSVLERNIALPAKYILNTLSPFQLQHNFQFLYKHFINLLSSPLSFFVWRNSLQHKAFYLYQ